MQKINLDQLIPLVIPQSWILCQNRSACPVGFSRDFQRSQFTSCLPLLFDFFPLVLIVQEPSFCLLVFCFLFFRDYFLHNKRFHAGCGRLLQITLLSFNRFSVVDVSVIQSPFSLFSKFDFPTSAIFGKCWLVPSVLENHKKINSISLTFLNYEVNSSLIASGHI